jgi:transcriptional regulator with XRE-family HTH domain
MTGHQLRVARARLGISQADLARVLLVTESSISRWENSDAPKIDPTHRELLLVVVQVSNLPDAREHGQDITLGLRASSTYALFCLLAIANGAVGHHAVA